MAKFSQISHFDTPERFPQCDFEDDAHPFCDWVQISGTGGHWTWSGKNMPTQDVHPFGVSLNRGEEIMGPSSQ